MTREEAIARIDLAATEMTGALATTTEPSAAVVLQRYIDALDMAVSALREQEERSKGCEYCRESENIYYHAGEVNVLDEILYITGDDLVVDIGCRFYLAASIKFCPMCGRRLEDDLR